MKDWQLKIAQVVDNNDPDKLSMVKVRILPEMKDFKEDDLPWAYPFILGTGATTSEGKHNPPENDSFITVLVLDNTYHFIYYMANAPLDGFAPYQNWSDIESKISDTGSHTYPNPRLEITADGNATYHNTETGEMGIFHNSGTYILIDTDGKIYAYGKNQNIKFYNDSGNIELKSSGQVSINDDNFTVDV